MRTISFYAFFPHLTSTNSKNHEFEDRIRWVGSEMHRSTSPGNQHPIGIECFILHSEMSSIQKFLYSAQNKRLRPRILNFLKFELFEKVGTIAIFHLISPHVAYQASIQTVNYNGSTIKTVSLSSSAPHRINGQEITGAHQINGRRRVPSNHRKLNGGKKAAVPSHFSLHTS